MDGPVPPDQPSSTSDQPRRSRPSRDHLAARAGRVEQAQPCTPSTTPSGAYRSGKRERSRGRALDRAVATLDCHRRSDRWHGSRTPFVPSIAQASAIERLAGVDRVLESGYLDALVMACRAHPELARRIVTDGTHREALRAILLVRDEPLARAAGLESRERRDEPMRYHPGNWRCTSSSFRVERTRKLRRSLFISEATTKVHVRHILRKLGVRSRVEAVRAWRPTVTSDSGFDDAG